MGLTTSLRELVGTHVLVPIGPFGELEAAVAATTELRLGGASFDAAGPAVMPSDGVIVGWTANCEAGSNFTTQLTVNGTPDTGVTMTVNSAKERISLSPANYVPFSEDDTIGVNCIADTTSKDVSVIIWVVLDVTTVTLTD